MRRTFALLALLATSWPHVASVECALAGSGAAEPAGGEAAESAHFGPVHGAHAHGAHAHASAGHPGAGVASEGVRLAGEDDARHGPTHQDRDCALAMACGLVMMRADVPDPDTYRLDPPTAGPTATIDAPQGTVLVADPPPPRRSA
jgi:hypothetical protein